ncbi:MAG: hypothetical protein HUU34_00850 [Saprospiraceae bacterium]|nr:hypothetical protein [Saprospiraceae bacterium]
MNINNFSEQIGDLIGKDDLQGAISLLSNLLKNSPKLDQVILQSARFNDIMSQIRMGIVNFEEADLTKNKIRFALLSLVGEIEEASRTSADVKGELDMIFEEVEKNQYTQNHSGQGDNIMNF